MNKKRLYLFLFVTFLFFSMKAQTIAWTPSSTGLYEFLDEMATLGIVQINSGIKPYTRQYIASKLKEIRCHDTLLTQRQKQELAFYSRSFIQDTVSVPTTKIKPFYVAYGDSFFNFSVQPLAGAYFYSNGNGQMYQRWVGAEGYATAGTHWIFHASLRDYKENRPFSSPEFLENRQGFRYKNATDYSEMRGGITYCWKWGTMGLVKDQFVWGTAWNGSNIFSGHIPSPVQLKARLTPVQWFEFNYLHAWLISEVPDSNSRVTGSRVLLNRPKYLTANMFSFYPFSFLLFSFGNSIIYYDREYPGYLIPVFFYKSLAHTNMYNGEAVNAQLFFDGGLRLFKRIHLYSTLFIDEISLHNMFNRSKSTNYLSWKAGCSADRLPVKNTRIVIEYTRTNPLTFQHDVEMTTFASNRFNLGHYLRDNAEEIYVSVLYKPWSTLRLQGKFLYARKGREYAGDRTGIYAGQPFIPYTDWKNRMVALSSSWQVLGSLFLSVEMQNTIFTGNPVYTAPYFWGHQLTWIIGMSYGF